MLSLSYSPFLILACIAVGIALSVLLYRRDTRFNSLSKTLRAVLYTLRAAAVSSLCFLLLSPMIKTQQTEIKKPVIVIAQDASSSMKSAINDSTTVINKLNQLETALGSNFDIKKLSFGERVREGFDASQNDKLTNMSEVLDYVADNYAESNVAGVVMATDGIYNESTNPLYNAKNLKSPIYTLAVGDTTPKKDIAIKRVLSNSIVYLSDKFNVQIDVAAFNCSGANTTLTVQKIDASGAPRTVGTQQISINSPDFFTTKEITIEATEAGVNHYRATISAVNGESTTSNNVRDFYIDVLDARTKILLLALAPHPDVSALNEALSQNKNYNVITAYASEVKNDVSNVDFVVLHQLPGYANNGADGFMAAMNTKKIPRLYIVGTQTDLRRLATQQNILSITSDGGRQTNEVQAVLNNNFNLFELNDNQRKINGFVPLTAPFGNFKVTGNGQTLYNQKIGKIETNFPLVVLGESDGIRTGIIAAEGLWKWRLFNYAQNQNNDITDDLFLKIIQYLSVKEDKRKFKVTTEKQSFRENETISFNAELYNNSFQRINTPDVTLTVTAPKGEQYNYTMNKNGDSYDYNIGVLPANFYRYKATTYFNGQKFEAEGGFNVQAIQLELTDLTANHALLRALSQQTGGVSLPLSNSEQLAQIIAAKKTKPMLFATTQTEPLLNKKWLFFLIAGFLSLEWFLRRYSGAY